MWKNEELLPCDSTIAPSLYRFGDSLEQWAEGVLDLCGAGPLVVVGSSAGGSCALEVARRAPEKVAAIVLVGAKVGHRPEPLVRDDALRMLDEGGMEEAWPSMWEPLFGHHANPAVIQSARDIAFAQDVYEVIGGVKAFHGRKDRTDFVKEWQKPFVVICGGQDRTPSPTSSAGSAGLAVKGKLHVVEGSGHYVNLERPDAVGRVLRTVLDERGGRI